MNGVSAAVLLAVALAAACSGPAAPPPEAARPATGDPLIDDCGPVTAGGFCGVVFGMSAAEAAQAFPAPLATYGAASEPLSCYLLFPAGRPDDLAFMVVDGAVGRIDVRLPGLPTGDGFGVGTREADILARYGARAEILPNKYDAARRDIVVALPPHGRFVFETDGERVLRYRVGVMPAVGFVEGCG